MSVVTEKENNLIFFLLKYFPLVFRVCYALRIVYDPSSKGGEGVKYWTIVRKQNRLQNAKELDPPPLQDKGIFSHS